MATLDGTSFNSIGEATPNGHDGAFTNEYQDDTIDADGEMTGDFAAPPSSSFGRAFRFDNGEPPTVDAAAAFPKATPEQLVPTAVAYVATAELGKKVNVGVVGKRVRNTEYDRTHASVRFTFEVVRNVPAVADDTAAVTSSTSPPPSNSKATARKRSRSPDTATIGASSGGAGVDKQQGPKSEERRVMVEKVRRCAVRLHENGALLLNGGGDFTDAQIAADFAATCIRSAHIAERRARLAAATGADADANQKQSDTTAGASAAVRTEPEPEPEPTWVDESPSANGAANNGPMTAAMKEARVKQIKELALASDAAHEALVYADPAPIEDGCAIDNVELTLKSQSVSFNLNQRVLLQQMQMAHPTECSLTATFPAIIVRVAGVVDEAEWSASATVHENGHVIINGPRTQAELRCAANAVMGVVRPYMRTE